MSAAKSFKQILDEHMDCIEESPSYEPAPDLNYSLFTALHENLSKRFFKSAAQAKVYPPLPKEEPAPLKPMTDTQEKAYQFFQTRDSLKGNWGLTELKKEFRKLAKRLHPDMNPKAQPLEFHQLKQNYLILEKYLQS